jgi:hypothetical protein
LRFERATAAQAGGLWALAASEVFAVINESVQHLLIYLRAITHDASCAREAAL